MPYYYIVVADSRAPRDGKFIERIGIYNPNTNPAIIDLNGEKALTWLANGAQPTDTCRAILSYKGVMFRKHLERGVKKGAFSAEEADKKFAQWLEDKANKIDKKIAGLKDAVNEDMRVRLQRESEVAHKRAQDILAKKAAAEAPAASEEEAEGGEENAEESTENE